ncbi:MAG: hypothetical protein ACLFUJ_15355, partial [Phycisphaerae bacterium]
GQGQGESQGQGAGTSSGDQGNQSGQSGGDPNSGSSDRRGDVDPYEGIPAGQREKLESIGRTIQEADRNLRDGQVDPELLKELNMTPQQYTNFVKRYVDQFQQVRQSARRGDGQPEPGQVVIHGSEQVQQGQSGKQELTGTEQLSEDEIRRIQQSRLEDISPEYREQVEQYFRNLGQTGRRNPDEDGQ